MLCRKDFMDLTADERDRLAAAFNDLHTRGLIHTFVHEHEHHFNGGIHRGPAFLPWHRYFLLSVENQMRSFDARVTLPYWDWTRADSRDLDVEPWKSFFGGRNNTAGRFDHWDYDRGASPSGSLPTLDNVLDELQAATYALFRAMEFGSHVPGHTWTGGTMASSGSPGDPLFYLHHCNVDRLWAIWQRNHPAVTQYTLDDCPGCPRIDESYVPLNSPMIGGATPASMLDHRALGYFYHRDNPLEARGVARGLPAIVSGDPVGITLQTPQIVFNDVPEGDTTKRAALFRVSGCATLTFHVLSGPTAPFSLFEPGPFPYPVGPLPTDERRIWVMFTGSAPGSVASGVMTVVARNEFGTEVQRWNNIPIFANSVARPRVAVAMVLDESGSMLYGAGNNRTRLDVLRLAANTFIDQLYDDNGLALFSFANTAAKLRDLDTAGGMTSMIRNNARGEIGTHSPIDVYQHTSIGAGIQEAANHYQISPLASSYDIKATIVFTDGFEDREPLISQVRPLINERVYAVGVADAANVRNDILRAVADNSGGFMLVTGALAQDDEFLLEKFFIQVLAGVMNRYIVRDPDGWVFPGQVARVPFWITQSDIAFDAVALSRWSNFLALALETPDRTILDPTQVPSGSYRPGATSRMFRITLPIVHGGREHWAGEWNLLLGLGSRGPLLLSHVPSTMAATSFNPSSALAYHALVHARSNLGMRATISQTATLPGATLHLRAVLTEYGQPLETHPQVTATLTRPDLTTAGLVLAETGSGEFQTSLVGVQAGVYRFLVRASGLSSRGQPFTREQLVTAVLGYPSDVTTGEPSRDTCSCDLLKCLLSTRVISDQVVERLKRMGINISELRRCIAEHCQSQADSQHDQPIK